jgi:hypothetical protein
MEITLFLLAMTPVSICGIMQIKLPLSQAVQRPYGHMSASSAMMCLLQYHGTPHLQRVLFLWLATSLLYGNRSLMRFTTCKNIRHTAMLKIRLKVIACINCHLAISLLVVHSLLSRCQGEQRHGLKSSYHPIQWLHHPPCVNLSISS